MSPTSFPVAGGEFHTKTGSSPFRVPRRLVKAQPKGCSVGFPRIKRNWSAIENTIKALAKHKPPLSTQAVAGQVGCARGTLRYRFPALHRRISQRFQKWRTKVKRDRADRLKQNVEQTIFDLHRKGVYPSLPLIQRILPKNSDARTPLFYQTWVASLQALGLR